MKTGIELITEERNEQISKHNRTIQKDVIYNERHELKNGAIALLDQDMTRFSRSWNLEICEKMVHKTYKERLIIAGAFIAAELDRINYEKNG